MRLLTLTGPGGVGKTRLALAAVVPLDCPELRSGQSFQDGFRFVSLASVADPALVASAIAQALDLRETGDRPFAAALTAHLARRDLLLVLDNVEHVAGAAPFVANLLQECPELTVLATSRERLGLSGEHEFTVPPLTLPRRGGEEASGREGEESEAIALFVERARALRPALVLTEEETAAIAEICHRLDGLPLAIELAAARTKLLPPSALLTRLAYRLDLLTGGPCDAPARHQTMRASIAWSYDLLSPAEQILFRRLSVFAGGFTLDTAEAVAGAGDWGLGAGEGDRASLAPSPQPPAPSVLDGIASLVDKSLVRHDVTLAGEPRFGLLGTIRDYGLEQLAAAGDEEAAWQNHACSFLALAEESAAAARVGHQESRLDRLETEHDNLRAALTWFAETGQTECHLRLAWALWAFWLIRGHVREGRAWLERAAEAARDDEALIDLRIDALYGAAWLAVEQGEHGPAVALNEESLSLARARGDREAIARVLGPLGYIAQQEGDYARAVTLHEESLRLKRAIGDCAGASVSLTYLGHLAAEQGEVDQAETLLEEALATNRRLGRRRHVALALDHLGYVAYQRGDLTRAIGSFDEALCLFRRLGDAHGTARTLDHLGWVARRQGDFGRAGAYYAESLALRREHGEPGAIAASLESVAALAATCGHAETALRLLTAAARRRAESGHPRSPARDAELECIVRRLRSTVGMTAFATAHAAGDELSFDEAIALATAMATAAAGSVQARPAPLLSVVDPFGLTPREQDVLHLLAKRYTDREIAEALFISPRTVARHVTGIFGKLGVHCRREAAAIAHGHGFGEPTSTLSA